MDATATTEFRSRCMRGGYLSQDRPDLMFAVKDSSRRMASPQQADLGKLTRIARYLWRYPRLAQRFSWQRLPKVLTVECDSDFAGCTRTRKSTSGYVALLGKHCIASRSVTQSVLATTTAEAEFYGLCSAISSSLGLQSLLADIGFDLSIRVGMDASAGLAMASRRGLGRAKHIHVQYLWVQELVANRRVDLHKGHGEDNRSDLLTKHLQAPRLRKLMESLGFQWLEPM